MSAKKKRKPKSSAASREGERESDFEQRREEFLQTFFRRGAEFTEGLLEENERLRYRLAELESETGKLRRILEKHSGVRDLMRRLETVQRENKDLLSRFQQAESVSRTYYDRYAEIERELNDLASLYVASFQLHSSLDFKSVLRSISELLHQLVGAQAYSLYLADSERHLLGAVLTEGLDGGSLPVVSPGVGPIGRAFASGETYVAESIVGPVGPEAPIACVPMRVDERIVGVIAVFRLLPQKTAFESIDFELFKLLGAHAATALVGSRLYSRVSEKPATLEDYMELLRGP